MKKISSRTSSVLLALLIILPLLAPVLLSIQIAPEVRAASATITLDVSQGYVGDYVTVTGRGFTPDKDVTFMWGDQLFSSLGFISGMPYYQRPSFDKPGEVWTDALGNFIVKLQVPKLTRGTYTIKADDTTTSATATFTINPRVILRNQYAYQKHGTSATPSETKSSANYIELFLAEGFVGDYLSLQLSGFGEGEITEVKLGTKSLINATVLSGTQKGYGFWTSAVRVPETPGGDYTATAIGKASGITASSSFKVKPELFLSRPPPGTPALSSWSWVHTFSSFGLSWYSSVNATASSVFWLEATGLSGTSIDTVTVAYDGGTPITCTVSGTLTIEDGSTQGINASTVPFVSASAFSAGLSPKATIPSAIPSGKMVTVTVATGGTGGASFTFTNQLFSSGRGARWTDGTLRWIEGDSTITSDGTSLSGVAGDLNELVATGCNQSGGRYWPSHVISTGSTVSKLDLDVLWAWALTPYPAGTPVSFYDVSGNGAWESIEPVYIDDDNSGDVTLGDTRVTQQEIGGKIYRFRSVVVATEPDLGRTLVKFPPETRPSYYSPGWWYIGIYLDKYNAGVVSEGDTRISEAALPIWWTWPSADINGFIAYSLIVPQYPGAGRIYDVGLLGIDGNFIVDSKVTMQIQASLEVTWAPTSYQSTYYVTEGSSVQIQGTGFLGNEALKISVGGKYETTVTPNAYGTLGSTWIGMPALAGGERPINATGVTTTGNKASTKVTYTPALSVSYSYPAYNLNPVQVTGIGFEPGTYQIIFDGAGIGDAVTSSLTVTNTGDEAGHINVVFNLPEAVEGNHILDIVKTSAPTKSVFYGASYFYTNADTKSNDPFPTDSEFPTVTIFPSLQSTPSKTTVGTQVKITGRGLQSSTTYYIWYDPLGTSTTQAILMTTTPETITTDTKGTLTASFQVPKSSDGTCGIWVSTSNMVINDVGTSIEIVPAIVLAQSSGAVGDSINVSFSGLDYGSQYQLWWYKPEEAKIGNDVWGDTFIQIPQTAIPLANATGALYGNSTEAIAFTVPPTAETGTVYAVDLSIYGSFNRYSELANPAFFTVGRIATMITLSLTPAPVTAGENVTINGIIQPAMSVSIKLFIKDPAGKTTNKTVLSSSSGTFTDTFKPDVAGTWQVTGKWDGNAVYAEYTSLAATVTVKPVDTTWVYAWTGIALGFIALLIAIFVILRYFVLKKSQKPPA